MIRCASHGRWAIPGMLAGVLLTACNRDPSSEAPMLQGIEMVDLVEAKDAPLLTLVPGDFIEASWRDGGWEFHQDGARIKAADPLSGPLSGISRLVISAPGDIKAEVVAELVRRSRSAGVMRIELLVRRASATAEVRVLTLLPASSSEIEPLVIGVAADGGVTTGTGASQLNLPSLGSLLPTLEMYAAAARAAAATPHACVLPSPDADYQRVVGVFGALVNQGIQIDWLHSPGMESAAPALPHLNARPPASPRSSRIQPLGLAPPEDAETKMKPMPVPD